MSQALDHLKKIPAKSAFGGRLASLHEHGLDSDVLQFMFVRFAEVIAEDGECSMFEVAGQIEDIGASLYATFTPFVRYLAGGAFKSRPLIDPLIMISRTESRNAGRPIKYYKLTSRGSALWASLNS